MDRLSRVGDELTQRLEQLSYPARLDVTKLLNKNRDGNVSSYEALKLDEVKEMRSYPTSPAKSASFYFRSYSGSWGAKRVLFKPKVGPTESPQIPRKRMEEEKEIMDVISVSEEIESSLFMPDHSTKLSSSPVKRNENSSKEKKLLQNGTEEYKKNEQNEESSQLIKSGLVQDRLRGYASNLNRRMSRVKDVIMQPLTPSTGGSISNREAPSPPPLKRRFSALEKKESKISGFVAVTSKKKKLRRQKLCTRIRKALTFPDIIEPQSRLSVMWLFIGCMCFVYNAWMIPMRSVFTEYQTEENLSMWLTFDYLCDFVYVFDIFFYKFRVPFLKNGTWVLKPQEIRLYYLKSYRFLFDILSLLPFDLFYFLYGPISAFRFPRLFKVGIFWDFFDRLDSVLSNPFIARMLKTVFYMVYTIHLNALVYYGMSKLEGIGSNSWVFQGVGNAYVRCYYFAIKTAISIGKNPKPVTVYEQALMSVAWLAGVFVFAVLLGQVKDIVLTATKTQDDYRRIMDQTLAYLHKFNIPKSTMSRVRLWFSYTWESQKTLDEIAPLKFLPIKLQLDIAIDVHIQTLSKVQLFQDCDANLLRDLVLKLKPVIYLPGDYVCKKGEVGKEMYIVKMGHVQVVGGPDGNTVFATLSEGSVFGEISLLAVGGGNRRTADVRSQGFSNLFVLSKEDLEVTIKDHPEAQKVLEKKAAKLIKDQKIREKESKAKEETPKSATPKLEAPRLFSAVFQVTTRKNSAANSITQRISQPSVKSAVSISLKNAEKAIEISEETVDGFIESHETMHGGNPEEILVIETTGSENSFKIEDDSQTPQQPEGDIDISEEIRELCIELIDQAVTIANTGVTDGEQRPVTKTAFYESVFAKKDLKHSKYSVVDADKKIPLPVMYEGVLYPSSAFKSKKTDGSPDVIASDELLLKSVFDRLAKEQIGMETDDDTTNGSSTRSYNSSNMDSFKNSSNISVDPISKKRGLIDLGSSVDSDEWEGADAVSSKRMNVQFQQLSLGSLSSPDSFDHLEMTINIPSTSSGSEIA